MSGEFEQKDVFVGGADGVHTYRIPSLVVAPGGALLAFCEARKQSTHDASPTDMVLKRSLDGGRTWGPLQRVLAGQGTEAIMNPCPVVDGGGVWLFCINAHKTEHWRHRQLLIRSDDDGRTWSTPVDITDGLGDDTFISGPGAGIRLRTGRLVVPGYTNVIASDLTRVASFSRVAFSDDHGKSWRLGAPVAYAMSNESQVVELSDGSLLINWRIQKKEGHPGCRGTAISRDGGATWSEPALAPALNEAPCQAGLTRIERSAGDGGPRLIFSNPDARPGAGERTRMTVRLSADEGRTWPVARLVHAGPSCYSCPAPLPDGRIGLLYEGGLAARYEGIRFARIDPAWAEAES